MNPTLEVLNWLATPANQKALACGVLWVFGAYGVAKLAVSTLTFFVGCVTRPMLNPPKL